LLALVTLVIKSIVELRVRQQLTQLEPDWSSGGES
jgi:hypothetical protein